MMKKGLLLSSIGMGMSLLGMTLFDEQLFWKFFFLISGVILAFLGASWQSKKPKRMSRHTP